MTPDAVAPRHRRRGLALLVGATWLAALWGLRGAEPPPPPMTYTLVPLAGYPLELAVDDADGELDYDTSRWTAPEVATSCAPFLQPYTAYPHWHLWIASRASSCTGEEAFGSFGVDADGTVTYARANLWSLTFHLDPLELVRLRTADRLSCVRTERLGYGEHYYRIGVGTDPDAVGGAHISSDSPMGQELRDLLDGKLAVYYANRLAALGPIRIRFTTPSKYAIEIDGTELRVRYRGGEAIAYRELEPEQLVDLVDALQAPPPPGAPLARGELRATNLRAPVALPGSGAPFELVRQSLDQAMSR